MVSQIEWAWETFFWRIAVDTDDLLQRAERLRKEERMMELVTGVKAGEQVKITYPGSEPRTVTETVLPPCSEKGRGQWYCVTHQKGFVNQFEKDTHVGNGKLHKLVWVCFLHGIEQP